jgi:hypothetical protein
LHPSDHGGGRVHQQGNSERLCGLIVVVGGFAAGFAAVFAAIFSGGYTAFEKGSPPDKIPSAYPDERLTGSEKLTSYPRWDFRIAIANSSKIDRI